MSQSAKIFGTLLGAFLLYITAKGELSQYWALLSKTGLQKPIGQAASEAVAGATNSSALLDVLGALPGV